MLRECGALNGLRDNKNECPPCLLAQIDCDANAPKVVRRWLNRDNHKISNVDDTRDHPRIERRCVYEDKPRRGAHLCELRRKS